jgi:hypothetical protein
MAQSDLAVGSTLVGYPIPVNSGGSEQELMGIQLTGPGALQGTFPHIPESLERVNGC